MSTRRQIMYRFVAEQKVRAAGMETVHFVEIVAVEQLHSAAPARFLDIKRRRVARPVGAAERLGR